MNIETAKNIAVISYLVVQLFSSVMYLVVRYHFNNFSIKEDKKSVAIVGAMAVGIIVCAVISGFLLYQSVQIFYA